MQEAIRQLLQAAVALVLVGATIWLYLGFGRVFVGMSGNMELAVVAIALWHLMGRFSKAADAIVGLIPTVKVGK